MVFVSSKSFDDRVCFSLDLFASIVTLVSDQFAFITTSLRCIILLLSLLMKCNSFLVNIFSLWYAGLLNLSLGTGTSGLLGMASAKGSENDRNMVQTGKNCLLPPKSPFPCNSLSYAEYGPNSPVGSKASLKPKGSNTCHQRTCSENLILEEQPSWLDELLNEPEIPVRRSHRRSSSDSFAYVDAANLSNIDYVPISQRDNKFNATLPTSSWGSHNFDHYSDLQQGSSFGDVRSVRKSTIRTWEAPLASMNHLGNLLSFRDSMPKNAGASAALKESDQLAEKQHHGESGLHEPKSSIERTEGSHAKSGSSENDRRAKQQFAQRSRVRKLQYIAELERNVQVLQAKGSEVAAELEFLNQQNLILSMENKTLKQRLESMAQEQLIKYLEHEVLEREVGRLRSLYQFQQHPQPQQQHPQPQQKPSSAHRRVNSRDLDSQFANLSLKHKEASSGVDAVNGPLRI
ncbi:hypothetical protein Dimus_018060 [Dionaea muscipula]